MCPTSDYGGLPMLSDEELEVLWDMAICDNWHLTLVGSDVRTLIANLRIVRERIPQLERELDAVAELGRGAVALGVERTLERDEARELLCTLPAWQPVRDEFWREAGASVACKLRENAKQIVDLMHERDSIAHTLREVEIFLADGDYGEECELTDLRNQISAALSATLNMKES
jgi:hypothetical protein